MKLRPAWIIVWLVGLQLYAYAEDMGDLDETNGEPQPFGDEIKDFSSRIFAKPPSITCPLLRDTTCSEAPVCIGVNGNGPKIQSHFSSMARVTELLGPIHGAVSGSSAATSTFYLESIHKNPYVTVCRHSSSETDQCCDLETQTVRISFLLKALEAVDDTNEVLLKDWLEFDDVGFKLAKLGYWALFGVARGLPAVNFDLIFIHVKDFLFNSDAYRPRLDDTAEKLASFLGDVSYLDFIREGPGRFEGVVKRADEIASFLAGYAPSNPFEWRRLMEVCATPENVLGKRWVEDIDDKRYSFGMTCGGQVRKMFLAFLKKRLWFHPRRYNDQVGGVFPNMITTAVLVDETYDEWKRIREEYVRNGPEGLELPVPDFDNLKTGFWGDKETMSTVEAELPKKFPDDLQTQKFLNLGSATWFDALVATLAEPGHKGTILSEEKKWVSLGGWLGQPSQVLSALGCGQIINLIGPGGPEPFGKALLERAFQVDDETEAELIGFSSTSNSSYDLARETQTGSICADWDSAPNFDYEAIARAGYDAPFFSNDQCLLGLGAVPYENGEKGEPYFGCFPLQKTL